MLLIIQTLISVISQLKTAKDGRHYFVVNGRCKYLPKGTINHVVTAEVATKAPSPDDPNNNKEGGMLYHFIKTHQVLGEIRVLTNQPTAKELKLHGESVVTKAPIETLDPNDPSRVLDRFFAISSDGNWQYQLIMKRLVEKGVPFRLNIVRNGCLELPAEASKAEREEVRKTWQGLVDKCNFAWANSSTSFFLQFMGVEGWSLAPMGVELLDAPKSAKRANEIVRNTPMFFYTENVGDVSILVKDAHNVPSKAKDGMTYLSHGLAIKMTANNPDLQFKIATGQTHRLNGRVILPGGVIEAMPKGCLIKGDMTIRPDKSMDGYDIITVSENLKDELRATEPFVMVTAHEHHVTHEATWDVQRLVMNPMILTHEHRMRDLVRLVTETKESIDRGEIPDWLLLGGNESHDDEIGSARESYTDFDTVPQRWQAAGFDIRSGQIMIFLAMGAVINRMAKDFNENNRDLTKGLVTGYAKSLWLPKSNAMVGLINTHGSMTEVGEYRTPHNGTKAYFSKKYGIILPDSRMEEIYSLIGGGDLDDSIELNLVKLWSSDPIVTGMMRANGVISASEEIPAKPEDAKYTTAVLRSPNGAGEFSFVEFTNILDLPWQFLDLSTVEVIDLAKMPLPQGEMMKKVTVQGIQSSLTYSRTAFTKDNALRQILAQQKNPGIGQAANAMMAWSSVNGPSMPPVIAAPFEQLVDGVQQLSDPTVFKAVKDSAQMASSAAIALMESKGIRVDAYMIPRFVGKNDIQKAREMSYDGPLSEFLVEYRKAIKEIHDTLRNKSLQMRDQQPLVQWVRELNFTPEAALWADDFNDRYTRQLSEIDAKYKGLSKYSGIMKLTMTREKHEAIRKVIDTAIAELRSFERPGQRALAVWYRILRKTQRMPYGLGDRLIFQQGNGEAIMDLIIPVLHDRGWGV